ncbi:Bacillus/Clostridium GerA spore germination protein [Pelotomaculum thermopropionicum SI]|uniref:Bacillus/Clostridium GerA spore germination protein n=1 Tax=Pelotomaculum thermopropionicum (strain DSM 13744 / JCM 10971 / SI) TaxID=370438 RepID=A5D2Z0_PELTS|nr:Bacillus/Clostridium GerA spore germination protein [Pelotomaculum thermopropionicum SI]
METEGKTRISKDLEENLRQLDAAMGIKKNFDVLTREMVIGGKKTVLLFVDGLTNDQTVTLVLQNLVALERAEMCPDSLKKLFREHIGYTEVNEVEYLEDIVDKVLGGPMAILLDGSEKALILDARIYPVRSPEEPDLERVIRGSRDGFVETLIFNTALIRRRIRDPKLRMEYFQVGTRSKSDIVVCYIEDIANPELVQSIKEKIEYIKIDGIPMGEKSVEELITPGSFWNPFPKVRYTERPDVAAMHLLEGHVLVLVDTSPSVIIAPATYFHHLQHAEEYRQNPTVGVYLRWVRFIGVAVSLFLLPLWFLLASNPELRPSWLAFVGVEKPTEIPLIFQFILAEIFIDMIRLATIHTPAALATATGIIAAVLIGELATRVKLFSEEVVLYTAVVAIGTFLTPSIEMANANKLVRLGLLILTALFGLPGFVFGVLVIFVALALNKSFGIPYLWPLIPLNLKALGGVLVRTPVPVLNTRPSILKPVDQDRQVVAAPVRKRMGRNK